MSKTKRDDGIVVNVSEKGQATIPKRYREKLGIDAPGKVEFHENDDGELVIEPAPSIRDFRGAGEGRGTPTLEESRRKDDERDESLSNPGV